jgi:hypothetical protein
MRARRLEVEQVPIVEWIPAAVSEYDDHKAVLRYPSAFSARQHAP